MTVHIRQVSADLRQSLKCIGTLITCPYTTGGRSRQGSPKAGANVQVTA